jgi:hypothetical protein
MNTESWEEQIRRENRNRRLKVGAVLVGCIAVIGAICIASGRNVDGGIACAPEKAKEMGFELAGYTGYNLQPILGGMAWYNLRKIPDNGIVYEAAFAPWKGVCMVYSLRALDAIKP